MTIVRIHTSIPQDQVRSLRDAHSQERSPRMLLLHMGDGLLQIRGIEHLAITRSLNYSRSYYHLGVGHTPLVDAHHSESCSVEALHCVLHVGAISSASESVRHHHNVL